jgi:uncharacterized metal-binding protein YceD (DUF177 family)
MNPFVAYSIPIQGLKTGIHHYKFVLDSAFFSNFEESPITECSLQYAVKLDKRPDMLLFDFEMEGYVNAECDRCTAEIELPIDTQRQLIVKYGDAEGETEDEVVFIHPETSSFNLAPYLYEFAVLALPITNTYDCQSEQNPPCNFEVLDYLKNDTQPQSGTIWDVLQGKIE